MHNHLKDGAAIYFYSLKINFLNSNLLCMLNELKEHLKLLFLKYLKLKSRLFNKLKFSKCQVSKHISNLKSIF